ncbi:ABC transporter permease [Arcobacter cloacae]|uniref:Transport permease protein n=1 Tax=Arcobacter cloacae TaxID=1054034 RepID=A0A4V1LVZ3_9BACT|nr:ABC transporter permease [Arcobacter cloacae]RXJ85795.1 multidrug ABC transporter permease [Arcobacter cloacae]
MKKYIFCMKGIVYKELIRFLKQKSRFFSALVRPLLWLFIFSVGFKTALGLAIIPPYETYITYETYIVPGLVGMVLLFNGMQSSLTMIFDREMGSMKILLTSYINRNYLLFCKMFATALVSTLQAITFLLVSKAYGIDISYVGIILTIPIIMISSIILNAFALFISSVIKQLENFATVMNFVIFPMFFLSSALYPLWKFEESSRILFYISTFNPFTYIVEFIRFTLYLKIDIEIFFSIALIFVVALSMAFLGFKLKKVNI